MIETPNQGNTVVPNRVVRPERVDVPKFDASLDYLEEISVWIKIAHQQKYLRQTPGCFRALDELLVALTPRLKQNGKGAQLAVIEAKRQECLIAYRVWHAHPGWKSFVEKYGERVREFFNLLNVAAHQEQLRMGNKDTGRKGLGEIL